MQDEAQNQANDLPVELVVFGESNPAVQAFRAMNWPTTPSLVASWIRLAKRCERQAVLLPEKDRLDATQIIDLLVLAGANTGEVLQFSIEPTSETEAGRLEIAFGRETGLPI